MAPNGARRISFLLIQTLPTFWAERIWILRILIFVDFLDPKFLDFQIPRFPKSGPWPGLGMARPGSSLSDDGEDPWGSGTSPGIAICKACIKWQSHDTSTSPQTGWIGPIGPPRKISKILRFVYFFSVHGENGLRFANASRSFSD